MLYGVSVFAHRPDEHRDDLLRRFAGSPFYLEASVPDVRLAGFDVLPTGMNPGHFDVQLVGDRVGNNPPLPMPELEAAARRLVETCGEMRPNPAYAGGHHD